MTPEELNELSSALRVGMQEAMRDLGGLAGSARGSNAEFLRNLSSLRGHTDALNSNTRGITEGTEAFKHLTEATKREVELDAARDRAQSKAIDSLFSLTNSALAAGGGLSKYSGAVTSATSALSGIVSQFGTIGKIAGIAIEGFGFLSRSALKYSDNLLKASDDLGQMGVAGNLTTEEIRLMAAGAKYSTDTISSWTKALGTMGPALAGFGSGVTDGTREFAKLTKLSREQISHYQAMGYSQEQLTQAQADSIGYYQKSGTLITEKMKTDGTIQRMSLEYVDNLSKLSALTGQSVAEAKKIKEQALAHTGLQIKYAKMDKEARDLEAAGRGDEAEAIRQRKKNMQTMVEASEATGDEAQTAGVKRFAATDGKVITKEMSQMAVGTPEIFDKMREGMKNQDKAQRMQFEFADAQRRNMERAPESAAISDPVAKSFGISYQGAQKSAPYAGKTEKEKDEWIKASQTKPVGGTVAEGDATQKGRVAQQTLEFAAQNFKDGVISFIGPMKLAVFGFAASVAAFALSVSGSLVGKLSSLVSKGAASTASSVGGGALSTGLKSAGKFAGKAAGPLAMAASVYEGVSDAHEGWTDANKKVASGEISKSEGAYKKTQAVGEGAGTAAGGIAGAIAGQALIPIPVVGAMIGGFIGSKLGGLVGKGAGSVAGLGAKALTSDKKPEETKREAEKVEKKGESLVEGPKSVYEQFRKLLLSNEIKDIYGAPQSKTNLVTKLPAAAEGGIFSGPKSGYPVLLHGTEAVVPEKKPLPNSDGTTTQAVAGGVAGAAKYSSSVSAIDLAKDASDLGSKYKTMMKVVESDLGPKIVDLIKKASTSLSELSSSSMTKMTEMTSKFMSSEATGKAVNFAIKAGESLKDLGKTALTDIKTLGSAVAKSDTMGVMKQFGSDSLKNIESLSTSAMKKVGGLAEAASGSKTAAILRLHALEASDTIRRVAGTALTKVADVGSKIMASEVTGKIVKASTEAATGLSKFASTAMTDIGTMSKAIAKSDTAAKLATMGKGFGTGAMDLAGKATASAKTFLGTGLTKDASGRFRDAAGKFAKTPEASKLVSKVAEAGSKLVSMASTTGTAIKGAAIPAIKTAGAAALPAIKTAGKVLGKAAGPLAMGISVYEGYGTAKEGVAQANADVKSGKITKAEGTVKKSEAVGTGVGQAGGGIGGGLAGAAAGAAMGSVVPVVGTIIGGIIGGALGAWGGAKAGKSVGGALGAGVGHVIKEAEPKKEPAHTGTNRIAEDNTLVSGFMARKEPEEKKEPITEKEFITPLKDSVTILEKFNIQLYDATETLSSLNGRLGKTSGAVRSSESSSGNRGGGRSGPRMPEDAHSVDEAKRLGAETPQRKAKPAKIDMGGGQGLKPGTGAPGLKPGGGEGLKIPPGDYLGKVAAQYESGGKSGIISSGKGDLGGKSYGAFQLAGRGGKAGNEAETFVKEAGYGDKFKGMKAGSAEFDAQWKEQAKDPKFIEAQAAHAKKTHYDPQMERLQKGGIDLSGRGRGVQEAVMSTANQYGAKTDLIKEALGKQDLSKMNDKQVIDAIQDYKAKSVKTRFKSSSADVQAGVSKRIERERETLARLADQPAQTTTSEPRYAAAKPNKKPEGIQVATAQDRGTLANGQSSIDASRTQMMTNSPAAATFASMNKPQEMGPPAAAKNEGFMDAIASLGDRLSGHFEKLIDHTVDGNSDIRKMQKATA